MCTVGVLLFMFATAGYSALEPPYYLKPGKPFAGQKINVLIQECEQFLGFQKPTAEFERLTGIKVNYVWSPWQTLHDKLIAEVITGAGQLDILEPTTSWIPEIYRFLESLDERIKADGVEMDFPQFIIDLSKDAEGKWISYPMRSDSQATFYRKDVFDELGLEAPDTWEDMVTVAKAVQANTDLAGVAMYYGVTSATSTGNIMIWATMLKGAGGDFFDAEWRPIFNNKIGVDATKRYVKEFLFEDQICPVGSVAFSEYEGMLSFQNGKSSMWLGLDDCYPRFIDPEISAVVGKFALTPIPKWKGKERANFTMGNQFCINKASRRKDAAWEWIKWAGSAKNQKEVAMAGNNVALQHIKNLLDEELNQKYDNLFKLRMMAFEAGGIFTWPLIPEWAEITSILSPAIADIATGMPVDVALNEAAKKVEQIMERGDYYK